MFRSFHFYHNSKIKLKEAFEIVYLKACCLLFLKVLASTSDLHVHRKSNQYNIVQQYRQLFACWVTFNTFCCLLIFFSNINFLEKNSFRHITRVSNSLYPDQTRHLVGPDLGPKCLHRLSADDTSRHKDKGRCPYWNQFFVN